MREMKGLVTGAGGLCGLRCVVFWHAVIKPSPTLTAQHLFTADFNFPDSPFPLPITPSHTLPHSPVCRRSHSLSVCLTHRTTDNPVSTSNNILSGNAQLQRPSIFCCTNPFVLSSFIFVYLYRPGGERIAGAFRQCCV